MSSERSKFSREQYLEANRLHRDGFVPVSNKYRRLSAPPALPPDDRLLALLQRVSPSRYEEILREIKGALARVLGEREAHVSPGTYAAIKSIEAEAMLGRFADLDAREARERADALPNRVIEIRREGQVTEARKVRGGTSQHDATALSLAVEEEVAKFDDATDDERSRVSDGLAFLRGKGIKVVLLTKEEAEERRRRILFGDDE